MPFSPWAAGERITAARLNEISPVWATWVPVWTTSSGLNTPSFGNAVISARYTQTADLVVARFEVVFGSTTNFGAAPTGSDNWRFTLPVTASSTHQAIGFLELNQTTGIRGVGRVRLTTTSVFEIEVSAGRPDGTAMTNTGLVDSITPWTWASTNAVRGTFEYEPA